MDGDGLMPFYKVEGDQVYVAQSAVYAPDYEIHIEDKDSYTYPINGWNWVDTDEEVPNGL
jgi:hypothetical protein